VNYVDFKMHGATINVKNVFRQNSWNGYFACNLCIFIVMSVYSYCMFMYLHRATWHSSATLTEVFPCFFLSRKANTKGKTRKDEARHSLFQIVVLFYVLFVLCRSVYCLCVTVYCTTATGWLPNCS